MMTPTARLQATVDATRAALDAGELTRLRASRRVARHCRVALRRHPYDDELGLAVGHVAARGFVPPPRAELPPGTDAEVWRALTGHVEQELEDLAGSVVSWPDPAEDPEGARRVLTLLLLVPAEAERARALLDALAPHCDAASEALWRFRLAAMRLSASAAGDEEQWTPLLEPLRALGPDGAAVLGQALTMAASGLIATSTAHGAEWLQPVLGGQLVLNTKLALRRRPALRHDLTPAIEWLEESSLLATPAPSTLFEVLGGVHDADEAGDFEAGTGQLEAALAMAADRHDLAQGLAARAAALGDATLMARATALGASPPPFTTGLDSIPRPALVAPTGGVSAWTKALQALSDTDTLPTDVNQLLFLERAGSKRRAALGWLARGSSSDLLQAARLGDALSDVDSRRLTDALIEALPDDELALSATDEVLGQALFWRLDDQAQRTLLSLRLGAVAHVEPGPTPESVTPARRTAPDDPHSMESRLAAARELLDADRTEAGSAIMAALLRHDEGPENRGTLVDLTTQALRAESPASALITAVARTVLNDAPPGPTLLSRLMTDAMAAYAVHEALHAGAVDRRRPESLRVQLLEAWFGIWAATETPPDPVGLQDLMHIDPVLLPLAASRLAGLPDPVASAASFLADHPPLETTPAEYGRALLGLVVSSAGSATP